MMTPLANTIRYVLPLVALAATAPDHATAAPDAPDAPATAPSPAVRLDGFLRQVDGLANPTDVAVDATGVVFVTETNAHRIGVIDASGKRLRSLGGLGRGPGQLRAPRGVALGPDGLCYVADTGNCRISVMDREGHAVRSFGSYGSGPGRFNHPVGVAVDAERVYIADYYNDRVSVFDHNGHWVLDCGHRGRAPGELIGPISVAVDPTGNIFVVDRFNDRVQVFGPTGAYVRSWGTWGAAAGMFNRPRGIAITGSTVLVTDAGNHRIQAFTSEGTTLYEWGAHVVRPHEGHGKIHYPDRIAVCSAHRFAVICESFEDRLQWFNITGDINAASTATPWWQKGASSHFGPRVAIAANVLALTEPDANTVLLFDATRDDVLQVSTFGSRGTALGRFIHPVAVAFNPSGNRLYVADAGTRRLTVLDIRHYTDGRIQNRPDMARAVRTYDFDVLAQRPGNKIPLAPIQPAAMVWGGDDRLFILDTAHNVIVELSPDMKPTRVIGGYGDGPGRLNHPTDLTAHDGQLFVVDACNHRVQIFDLATGDPVRAFGGYGTAPGQFIDPFGISIDPSGLIHVTDAGSDRISTFTAEGDFVSTTGTRGIAAGEFFKPRGIAHDAGGRCFVVDHGNHRVQVFDKHNRFLGAFGARFYVQPAKADAQ